MPCFDDRENSHTEYVYLESGKQTARLCAVLSVLEKQGILGEVLAQADWKESGVSSTSTLAWWNKHKEEDKKRRQKEQAEKQAALVREQQRKAALSKLSPSDKKALGIKE